MSNLLDNAHETFEKTLLSISGRIVVWGAFKNDEELSAHYLSAKGKINLTDKRCKFSDADRNFKEEIECASQDAYEYVQWVRERGGQPILQESLVTYCAAFENCLKTIAVAFVLAGESGSSGIDRQIFVPGEDLRKARRSVSTSWDRHLSNEVPRVQLFFEKEIAGKNPDNKRYEFQLIGQEVWAVCGAAFKLRNAVLHSMGRPSEQIELGGSLFHPGWEIELSAKDLRMIKTALEKVLFPFSRWALI